METFVVLVSKDRSAIAIAIDGLIEEIYKVFFVIHLNLQLRTNYKNKKLDITDNEMLPNKEFLPRELREDDEGIGGSALIAKAREFLIRLLTPLSSSTSTVVQSFLDLDVLAVDR